MENQRDSRLLNLNSSGGGGSPINVPNFVPLRRIRHSLLTPSFDPYVSNSSDSPSPMMKYLRSAAPALASTVPSSPVFATPLKVEEDVLVMDGIPVPKSNIGGRARGRATMTPLNLNSASLQPGGVRAENSNSNKEYICRHWEDSVICRYGSKCQFAHGKEELRPPRFSGKNKLEIFKTYNSSSGSGSSSRGRNSCSVNKIIAASATASLLLPIPPTPIVSSIYTLEINTKSGSIDDSKYPNPALLSSNWSPLDDGIEVILPLGSSERQKNPWKEDLEAEIQKALYCTGSTKRLPVFLNISTD
ncbi:uncharacterized protein [Henckelia pumila]|uniref:uncharacterized protein n=1 Tax=Henckelia pumila TaxID=405737 RepID=UPI003C6E394A